MDSESTAKTVLEYDVDGEYEPISRPPGYSLMLTGLGRREDGDEKLFVLESQIPYVFVLDVERARKALHVTLDKMIDKMKADEERYKGEQDPIPY